MLQTWIVSLLVARQLLLTLTLLPPPDTLPGNLGLTPAIVTLTYLKTTQSYKHFITLSVLWYLKCFSSMRCGSVRQLCCSYRLAPWLSFVCCVAASEPTLSVLLFPRQNRESSGHWWERWGAGMVTIITLAWVGYHHGHSTLSMIGIPSHRQHDLKYA